ncbi:MAG: T9SS type A sorting domain-containing protein [Draconibacterium sp.]|nr:T9SS type A sorting domain-containing protein [Draconibacterium sp.]
MKQLLIIFLIFILMAEVTHVSAQYQIPLYAPGNTGGQITGNNYSALAVTGQNVIGVSASSDKKVYLGLLAPMAIIFTGTDIQTSSLSELGQNFPNPYKNKTTIPFNLARMAEVTLTIYDVLGQKKATLLNQEMPQGKHNIAFNADGLTPGLYLYQLEVENKTMVKTMALTK